jgi:hypothetical protein
LRLRLAGAQRRLTDDQEIVAKGLEFMEDHKRSRINRQDAKNAKRILNNRLSPQLFLGDLGVLAVKSQNA